MEEEFIAVLKEKMPEYGNSSILKEEDEEANVGLGTISEANEETEDLR